MSSSRFEEARYGLSRFLEQTVPRILTQIDRDPLSPSYGCCDRNWWHYRIRDFPSIILQQAGYAVHLAGQLAKYEEHAPALDTLAAASCAFWSNRASRFGAFEEYYPWERGFPPLAFSTLSMVKLAGDGTVGREEIIRGVRAAAKQLTRRFESEAANQQVAGLAALAWIKKLYPDLVTTEEYETCRNRTLDLQSSEGWFVEYGGPDLGYLSVILDCLWDLHDATGEEVYLDSAGRSLEFMAELVEVTGASIGMHNARNTDYLVPYGLLRSAHDHPTASSAAIRTFEALYRGAGDAGHFLWAIDDRYTSHYIGHSIVRACLLMERRGAPATDSSKPRSGVTLVYPDSGYFIHKSTDIKTLISMRKGGVLTIMYPLGWASDFGWSVKAGKSLMVSHWWSDSWDFDHNKTTVEVRGHLVPHSPQASTPGRHLLLRVLSGLFGPRLISLLKRRLIFQTRLSRVRFKRRITIEGSRVVVVDRLSGLPPGADVSYSPRASKRHVSSANSYHIEDLTLAEGFRRESRAERRDGEMTITSTFLPTGVPNDGCT